MTKTRLKILIILLIAIVAISTVSAVSAAVDSVDSKDKVYSVESKEKSAANKITWNANGGKIGSKSTIVTTVKKGSKIGKLPTTPKRSGYTFNGWYTKKTGGSKITANTKPSKAVSYFAQWKKVTPAKDDGKKFIGKWRFKTDSANENGIIFDIVRTFKSDGTYTGNFNNVISGSSVISETRGTWSAKNQKITTKEKSHRYHTDGAWGPWRESDGLMVLTYTKKDGKDSLYVGISSRQYYYKV